MYNVLIVKKYLIFEKRCNALKYDDWKSKNWKDNEIFKTWCLNMKFFESLIQPCNVYLNW